MGLQKSEVKFKQSNCHKYWKLATTQYCIGNAKTTKPMKQTTIYKALKLNRSAIDLEQIKIRY